MERWVSARFARPWTRLPANLLLEPRLRPPSMDVSYYLAFVITWGLQRGVNGSLNGSFTGSFKSTSYFG